MSDSYWIAGVFVGDVCKCSMNGDSLSKLLTRCISDSIYYQAVYPSATITIKGIREQCSSCNNEGIVLKKNNKFLTMKCPNCKGKGKSGCVDDVLFNMPDGANNIVLKFQD